MATDEDKLRRFDLMQEAISWIRENVADINKENAARDGFLIVCAIINNGHISFMRKNFIVDLLKMKFPEDHGLWAHVKVSDG